MKNAIEFTNSARAEFSLFTNAATSEDGWMHVAPIGDFEGIAREIDANGVERKTRAVQRIDAAAIAQMCNSTNKVRGLSKFLKAPPLFLGHPNKDPHLYPDKAAKGVFVNFKAADAGLFAEPVLTEEGEQLVQSKLYPGISGHWDSEDTGEKTASGLRIFRPLNFLSAGLVKSPNLPTFLNENTQDKPMIKINSKPPFFKTEEEMIQFLNGDYPGHPFHGNQYAEGGGTTASSRASGAAHDASREAMKSGDKDDHEHAAAMHKHAAAAANKAGNKELTLYHDSMANMHAAAAKGGGTKHFVNSAELTQPGPHDMNKTKIVPLLTQAGFAEITNDSTGAQLEAAIGQIATRAARASALEIQFTNERAERIGELLGRALESGKITAAEKPDWERRLKADFTNEKAALDKLTPKIKTASAINRGDAKPGEMTAAARTQFCNELIGELAGKHHLDRVKDYNRLFTMAQEARPDLFQGMKRSAFNKPAGS